MCDVCLAEGLNTRFMNGKKSKLYNRKIYSIFRGKVTPVKLCFLHDIDLFIYGETKFLEYHPRFVMRVLNSKSKVREKDSFERELGKIAQLI